MIYQIEEVSFVVGDSPQMRSIFELLQRVSPTDSTILLSGETGVGKEVAARYIHHFSARRTEPFIAVNCTALSPQLIESELFGHEKGAFTGAEATRLGRFETADKGTLLLDEISELDPKLQAKLLRVLESRSFERVGSSLAKKTDARIIATTNQHLPALVKEKSFRADLYFRLNVIPIEIPPLRARREDILPLVQYFLTRHCHQKERVLKSFSPEAQDLLWNYAWPGNVRELSNLVERLVVLSLSPTIGADEVKPWLISEEKPAGKPEQQIIGWKLDELERTAIEETLKHFNGNRRRTAEALAIPDRTLRDKLRRYHQSETIQKSESPER